MTNTITDSRIISMKESIENDSAFTAKFGDVRVKYVNNALLGRKDHVFSIGEKGDFLAIYNLYENHLTIKEGDSWARGVTGQEIVLDNEENRWFLEELFSVVEVYEEILGLK